MVRGRTRIRDEEARRLSAPFEGVGVALVTLFDDDLDVDENATADLAARLVDAGLTAIVVAGSTGEAETLSAAERVRLIAAVRARVPSQIPVLAGTGAPSAFQAIEFTRDAAEQGAAAALALTPVGLADPRPYYDAIAKAVPDIALMGYHFPAKSAPGIPARLLDDLPVVATKDSTGSAENLLLFLESTDKPVYPGSPALLAMAAPMGCPGAILALANAEPELCIKAFGGDMAAQRALGPALVGAKAGFPAGIKGLTAKRFGTATTARIG